MRQIQNMVVYDTRNEIRAICSKPPARVNKSVWSHVEPSRAMRLFYEGRVILLDILQRDIAEGYKLCVYET